MSENKILLEKTQRFGRFPDFVMSSDDDWRVEVYIATPTIRKLMNAFGMDGPWVAIKTEGGKSILCDSGSFGPLDTREITEGLGLPFSPQEKRLIEVVKGLQINEWDIITSPGMFEGEMECTPYFYDMALNGMESFTIYDNILGPIPVFEVDEEERRLFGLESKYVALATSEQGFVSSVEYHLAAKWLRDAIDQETAWMKAD